jgi:hypothetical protein
MKNRPALMRTLDGSKFFHRQMKKVFQPMTKISDGSKIVYLNRDGQECSAGEPFHSVRLEGLELFKGGLYVNVATCSSQPP